MRRQNAHMLGSRRNKQLPFKVLFISKKKRRQLLQENKLLSIKAALDRHLLSPPFSKKVSICDTVQFNEANKALNSFLKHLASSGKIAGTVHKNPLTAELFEARELASAETRNPRRLLATTIVVLHFTVFW